MHFVDVLEIFCLDESQISYNLLKKAYDDSMPFFPQAPCFATVLFRYAQKSKFGVFG